MNAKIGCPAFILLEEFRKDFPKTVERVANLGFDGIEFTEYFGFSAAQVKAICEENGLQAFSGFLLPPDEVSEAAAREKVHFIRETGADYLTLSELRPSVSEERWQLLSAAIDEAGKQGLKVQYHNHGHEFKRQESGHRLIEEILLRLPRHVLFEPDLGWMGIGGYDPLRFLQSCGRDMEVFHLKDYARSGHIYDDGMGYRFRPTGYGVLDWDILLSEIAAHHDPLWLVADHDKAYAADPFQELRLSKDFICRKWPEYRK